MCARLLCTDRKIMCLCIEAVLRHSVPQGELVHQYCHHQLGSVAPGGAETANIPPTLAPIYPVITLLSKHNVSSGCLASVCLNIEMREAKNDGAPRRSTETKENTCLCEL